MSEVVETWSSSTLRSGHDLMVFALATHSIILLFARRRGRDVTRADDKVAEVLAVESLERETLDHRQQDSEDLWLRHGFWWGKDAGE